MVHKYTSGWCFPVPVKTVLPSLNVHILHFIHSFPPMLTNTASSVFPLLKLPTVPSSPQDLIARAKSHTEVSVTWSQPQSDGGTPITMYNVTYSMVDGGLKWQDVTGSNDMDPPTSTEIKGLSPQTEYNISVYAINVVDASEPAVTVVRTAATPLSEYP